MTPTELQQFLRDKLRKAYNFGQTYWQQADSEYRRENKKADETAAKFAELVENVVLAVKFEMDRAATEAAKATGTAGDLPELPQCFGSIDVYHDSGQVTSVEGWTADQMRGYAIDYAMQFGLAARQPAPVELSYLQLLAIADDSEAHEALQGFSEDPTQDNGVCVVRAILAATNRSQP